MHLFFFFFLAIISLSHGSPTSSPAAPSPIASATPSPTSSSQLPARSRSENHPSRVATTVKTVGKKKSYQQTTETLLLHADQAWDIDPTSLISDQKDANPSPENQTHFQKTISPLEKKLTQWRLPLVTFDQLPISDALLYLRQQTARLDPKGEGINFFLKLPNTSSSPSFSTTSPASNQETSQEKRSEDFGDKPLQQSAGELSVNSATNRLKKETPPPPTVTLTLRNITLINLLHYIAKQTDLELRIDPNVVCFMPTSENQTSMQIRHYSISPTLFPANSNLTPSNKNKDSTLSARKELIQYGICFPPGAIAHYDPNSGELFIRNTSANITLLESLLSKLSREAHEEVIITTRFLEINQDQLQELGLDALLQKTTLDSSQLSIRGEANLTGSPSISEPLPENPLNAKKDSFSDPSGEKNAAIEESSLPNASSENLWSIRGIYSTSELKLILHALESHQGIDLMAAPQLTTRSAHSASIEITHELTYPTHYAPPEIPETTTNNFLRRSSFKEVPPVVTPNFPDQWGHQKIGVTLEAEPFIHHDHQTVTMKLHPRIVDFNGFINYGTPINTIGYHFSATEGNMIPRSETITTNSIKQPLFDLREIETSVTLKNNQTLLLGGLIREEEETTENKIPLISQIPLFGSLFKAKKIKKVKKNLIIFVTPTIITS